jgi:hypothetical protein
MQNISHSYQKLIKRQMFRQVFENPNNVNLHEHLQRGRQVVQCTDTDRQVVQCTDTDRQT